MFLESRRIVGGWYLRHAAKEELRLAAGKVGSVIRHIGRFPNIQSSMGREDDGVASAHAAPLRCGQRMAQTVHSVQPKAYLGTMSKKANQEPITTISPFIKQLATRSPLMGQLVNSLSFGIFFQKKLTTLRHTHKATTAHHYWRLNTQ